jgi:hypothetical protein
MDENPYRSPQVQSAPPPPPWTPNYRSAAFGSVGLTIFTLTTISMAGNSILDYAQTGTADPKHLSGLALAALLVAGHVHWVWAALRHGKRC